MVDNIRADLQSDKHAAAEKVDVEVIDSEASGYVNAEKKAAARAPAPAPVAVSPEDRAATSPEDRTVARPRWRIPQSDKEQSAEDAARTKHAEEAARAAKGLVRGLRHGKRYINDLI